ncbi:hypothetical protein MtrunA17_Chr8g0362171 [Medicago truncatula]|uniref:Uncharacterized protein n=1 Tax=Medicago truncatula TaxID=3880 RepID=A0A396GQX9_MEDTR|nr:hypothetical protein MtrunA17_Chr8g0362171 [Medicago truncatula]
MKYIPHKHSCKYIENLSQQVTILHEKSFPKKYIQIVNKMEGLLTTTTYHEVQVPLNALCVQTRTSTILGVGN